MPNDKTVLEIEALNQRVAELEFLVDQLNSELIEANDTIENIEQDSYRYSSCYE